MAPINPRAYFLPAIDYVGDYNKAFTLGAKRRRQPELDRQADVTFANRQAQEARRAEASQYGITQRGAAEAQRAATTANIESQTAKREADAQRRRDFDEAWQKCKTEGTYQCRADLRAQFPNFGKALKDSHEPLDEANIKNRAASYDLFIQQQKNDPSGKTVRASAVERLEAAKKSNRPQYAQELTELIKTIDRDPEDAMVYVQHLADVIKENRLSKGGRRGGAIRTRGQPTDYPNSTRVVNLNDGTRRVWDEYGVEQIGSEAQAATVARAEDHKRKWKVEQDRLKKEAVLEAEAKGKPLVISAETKAKVDQAAALGKAEDDRKLALRKKEDLQEIDQINASAAPQAEKDALIASTKAYSIKTSELEGNKYAFDNAISDTVKVLDDLVALPGLPSSVGRIAGLPWIMSIKGVASDEARAFNLMHEQAKQGVFVRAFQQMKGAGQITDEEGRKATAALARMDAAQNEKDYRLAVADFRQILRYAQAAYHQRLKMPISTHEQAINMPRGKPFLYVDDVGRVTYDRL